MRRERGSVSVVLGAGLLVVLVMVLGLADLTRVLAARSEARAAADAAALAAAQELALPTGLDPVEVAVEYADANGGELSACTCVAGSSQAVVEVHVDAGALFLVPGPTVLTAQARAVVDLPSL